MKKEDWHKRLEVGQALKDLFNARDELAHEWLVERIRLRRQTISQIQEEIVRYEEMRTQILEKGAAAMDLLEKVGLKINPSTLEVEGGELHPIYGDLCKQKLTNQVACGGDCDFDEDELDSEEDRDNYEHSQDGLYSAMEMLD
jgi:hypothetical protein